MAETRNSMRECNPPDLYIQIFMGQLEPGRAERSGEQLKPLGRRLCEPMHPGPHLEIVSRHALAPCLAVIREAPTEYVRLQKRYRRHAWWFPRGVRASFHPIGGRKEGWPNETMYRQTLMALLPCAINGVVCAFGVRWGRRARAAPEARRERHERDKYDCWRTECMDDCHTRVSVHADQLRG